jgi:hypothetical protein
VTFDVNHLADWTAEEYQSLLGFRKSPLESSSYLLTDGDSDMPAGTMDDDDMPAGTIEEADMQDTIDESSRIPGTVFDWRNKGVLNRPFGLDQSKCQGMDWAIVAVAAMESVYRITFPKTNLYSLSKQQLIDCATTPNYYSHGCNGGDPVEAYRYAKDWGMMLSLDYPYRF